VTDFVRDFWAGSLSAAGAMVEEQPSGELLALLPAPLAAALALPEEVRIVLSEGDSSPDCVDGRLGSRSLERLVARRLTSPPITAVRLPPELPRPLPAHLPVLLNAIVVGSSERTRCVARYLIADIRLTAQSDEVRSLLETVCLRLSDGALVSSPRLAGAEARELPRLDTPERDCVHRALSAWFRREAIGRMQQALDAVQRRARRDMERMADYYASLDREMEHAARRTRRPDERARREGKRQALVADLAARRAQLRERLQPRLSSTLIAATLVETEIEAFTLVVRRRNREGRLTVIGRSADSVFEGPRCVACGQAVVRLYLCDEKLHCLCDRCGQSGRLDTARCTGCRPRNEPPPRIVVDDPTAHLRLGAR